MQAKKRSQNLLPSNSYINKILYANGFITYAKLLPKISFYLQLVMTTAAVVDPRAMKNGVYVALVRLRENVSLPMSSSVIFTLTQHRLSQGANVTTLLTAL